MLTSWQTAALPSYSTNRKPRSFIGRNHHVESVQPAEAGMARDFTGAGVEAGCLNCFHRTFHCIFVRCFLTNLVVCKPLTQLEMNQILYSVPQDGKPKRY